MIYDCFTFFNELDVLEIRLNILKDVVDRFVIVESTVTHQGKPKPLYFQENRERFRAFDDKIIYVLADDPPSLAGAEQDMLGNKWQLENWQRQCVNRGLVECKDDDVLIFSDLDEIPKPEQIMRHLNDHGLVCFEMDNHYFYLDYRVTIPPYRVIRMLSYAFYRDVTPCLEIPQEQRFRTLDSDAPLNPNKVRALIPDVVVPHSAWHFSWIGGLDSVIEKQAAQVEQQHNNRVTTNREWIKKRVYDGYETINSQNLYYPMFCPWRLPKYVRQNKERYRHLFYQAPLPHKLRLQLRFLCFRFLSFIAAGVRKVFGHVQLIQVIKRLIVK